MGSERLKSIYQFFALLTTIYMIFRDGPVDVKIDEITTNNTTKTRKCVVYFYFNCINSLQCSSYNFSYIDKAMYDFLFEYHYDYRLISSSHNYTVYYEVYYDTSILVTYRYNGIIELGLSCLRNLTQDIPYYSRATCTYLTLDSTKVFEYTVTRDQATKIMRINITKSNSIDDANYFIQALNYNKSMRNMPYTEKIYISYPIQ